MSNETKMANVLLKRRLSFTVQLEVEIRDVPQAIIDEDKVDPVYGGWKRDDYFDLIRFQKRLLQAVVEHPGVLQELLVDRAGYQAAECLNERWVCTTGISDEDIIAPIIETLLPEDQHLLKRITEAGVFSERTEIALLNSFRTNVVGLSIEEIE